MHTVQFILSETRSNLCSYSFYNIMERSGVVSPYRISQTSSSCMFEVLLIVILALHAHVQPYQNKLHNKLDALIFTNLAVINAISVINYSFVSRATFSNLRFVHFVDAFSAIQLALIFLPLGILAGYIVYCLLLKFRIQLKKKYEKAEEEADKFEMPARLIYSDEESVSGDDYHHSIEYCIRLYNCK